MAKKHFINVDIKVQTTLDKKGWLFDFIDWLDARGEKCGGAIGEQPQRAKEDLKIVQKKGIKQPKKSIQEVRRETMPMDNGWEDE